MAKAEENISYATKQKKANWIGQIWRRSCSKIRYWMKYRRDEKAMEKT